MGRKKIERWNGERLYTLAITPKYERTIIETTIILPIIYSGCDKYQIRLVSDGIIHKVDLSINQYIIIGIRSIDDYHAQG